MGEEKAVGRRGAPRPGCCSRDSAAPRRASRRVGTLLVSPWPCPSWSVQAQHPQAHLSESHAYLCEPQQVTGNRDQKRSQREAASTTWMKIKVCSQEDVCPLSHQATQGGGTQRLLRRGRGLRSQVWAGRSLGTRREGLRHIKKGGSLFSSPHRPPSPGRGLAVCQGTKSENEPWMGEVRRGMRGTSDPPGSLASAVVQLRTSARPCRKSPPCVRPPLLAAGPSILIITDRNPEGPTLPLG